MEHARIDRNGVSLAYRVDGPDNAPSLLLCHSLGTTWELWSPQMNALTRHFRVIRYDVRGHGRSSVAHEPYALADLGLDACAVLDAAGAPFAHIAGVSLGGLTAMWLAVHASQRVRGLVLANTAARLGNTARWDDRIALIRDGGMAAIADVGLGIWLSAAFREREPAVAAEFRRTLVDCAPEGYIGGCLVLRDADLGPDLGRVEAPTLIISGDLDMATPLADGARLLAGIPGARLATLHAAHLSNVEEPERFTDAVMTFLAPLEETRHG